MASRISRYSTDHVVPKASLSNPSGEQQPAAAAAATEVTGEVKNGTTTGSAKPAKVPKPAAAPVKQATIDDGTIGPAEFKKIQLRTGRIVKVEDHPDADKLFVLRFLSISFPFHSSLFSTILLFFFFLSTILS